MSYWPTITARQARALEGKPWTIDGRVLYFGSFHIGGEAFASAMVDGAGRVVAFLRFLNKRFTTPGRIHRTEWLIAQRLDSKSDLFTAAPRAWASTGKRSSPRPPGIDFDFTATVHNAAPGKSWKEMKAAIDGGLDSLPCENIRITAAKQLITSLATLEVAEFVHGDLSDGNVVIDPSSGSLRLIDFDALVFKKSTTLAHPQLPTSLGGVKGTTGYMPADLEQSDSPNCTPYSDRHARDMLLLEILGFVQDDPPDLSPKFWGDPHLTLEAVSPLARKMGMPHLCQPTVFSAPENTRPSSRQLASILNL